jgi:quercetin dioxygenase-like cupin family protein
MIYRVIFLPLATPCSVSPARINDPRQEGNAVAGEHYDAQARRVIAGVDEHGRSTVITDELTPRRATAPAFTICDIWETPFLPVPMDTPAAVGEVSIYPPKTGFAFRVCTFPPDSEYDKEAAYKDSLDALQGGDTFRDDGDIPGMHIHETLDIVTVISGELHIVLETGETLLRQGDSVILRGVVHSWSNKTDKPVVLTSLMMGASLEG